MTNDPRSPGEKPIEQETLAGDEAAEANARALASVSADQADADESPGSQKRPPLRIVADSSTSEDNLIDLFAEDVKEHRPRGKNRFVAFMSAYADAIDRDICLTLDA